MQFIWVGLSAIGIALVTHFCLAPCALADEPLAEGLQHSAGAAPGSGDSVHNTDEEPDGTLEFEELIADANSLPRVWLKSVGLAGLHSQCMALKARGRWLFEDKAGGVAVRYRRALMPAEVQGTPMKYTEGGVQAFYQFQAAGPFHVTMGLLAGMSRMSWYDHERGSKGSDHGVVVVPEMAVGYSPDKHMRLGVGTSWRMMSGIDEMPHLQSNDLQTFTGSLFLEFVDF